MNARLIGLIASMAALLGAALATGARVYYALLLLLLMMILYALVSVVWTLLTVRVEIRGLRPRVVRGERLMMILTVRHRSILPVDGLRVVLDAPGGADARQEIRVDAPPFREESFRSVMLCGHRGCYEVGVRRITAQDIFGLFSLSRRWKRMRARVEVCPRAMQARRMELHATDVGPEYRSSATEDNASPTDIRKWQNGDELKKVHWKLSMRKRELMVRTFEESARPDTLIIPDLGELTALRDQRLTMEDCICEAALGAAKAQLEAGFPVIMPLRGQRPRELAGRTAADVPGFADALMRAAFDSPYPYEQVLSLMLQRMQRTGGAILITAGLSSRVVDAALRMLRRGIQLRLIWVSDAPRDEMLEMLEMLKMAGAQTERIDPWTAAAPEANR